LECRYAEAVVDRIERASDEEIVKKRSAISLMRLRRSAAPVALVTACAYLFALAPARAQASAGDEEAPTSARSIVDDSSHATHGAVPVSESQGRAPANPRNVRNGGPEEPNERVSPAQPPASTDPPPSAPSTPAEADVQHLLALPTGGTTTGVSAQSISLPSGSGTALGMGESFSAQLSTGVASLTVPMATLSGRGLVQTSLVLGYSSGGGHSVAGLGWGIGFASISRQTDRGAPRYLDPAIGGPWSALQDRFVYGGGEELVPICLVGADLSCTGAADETMPLWAAKWQYFRARIEGEFLRFFWSPDHRTWRVQDKQGSQMELGVPLDESNYEGALETNPDDAKKIFQWNVARQYDTHVVATSGQPLNVIAYRYLQSGGMAYVSDVYATPPSVDAANAPLRQYAQHVRLIYETRVDQLFSYRRGWETRSLIRLSRMDVSSKTFTGGPNSARQLVRRVHLAYEPSNHVSLLQSVQVEGRCAAPVAEDQAERLPETSGCARLPPMMFGYQHVDGYDTKGARLASTLAGFEAFDERLHDVQQSPPHGLDEALTTLWDINADALPDVLVTAPALFDGKHGVYFNGEAGRSDSFGASSTIAVDSVLDADANTL
jgi:hypothetical protein